MKIAIVTGAADNASMARWLRENDPGTAEWARWIIDPLPAVAEQVLDALVAQWQQAPADIVLFPAGALGDELATRLAWRLQGASLCQITSLAASERRVTKPRWGNALTATLAITGSPLCLSLARLPETSAPDALPTGWPESVIAPAPLPHWLVAIENIVQAEQPPLSTARQVLVAGGGGDNVDAGSLADLARRLHCEVGYSRARVMRGGYDAGRQVGISGLLLSPEICILAGASGAAALMSGVRESRFIVAINTDASAPVFAQADVGIVDDWLPVLEALAARMEVN